MKYHGSFKSLQDVKEQFAFKDSDLRERHVIFANYDGGGWEGSAYVLFRRGSKMFEAFGSHCSCYGLEGQWKPEEVSMEVLKKRMRDNDYVSCAWNSTLIKEALEE